MNEVFVNHPLNISTDLQEPIRTHRNRMYVQENILMTHKKIEEIEKYYVSN